MQIRLSAAALMMALLFLVGCRHEFSADQSEDHSIAKQDAADQSAAEHVDVQQADAAENSAPVLLTERNDGYFTFPWLSLRNVDDYIAEVHRRDVRRLYLNNDHRGRIADEHKADLLRRIVAECPNLEALFLSSWILTASDLDTLLTKLPQLQELSMYSCVVMPGERDSPDVRADAPAEARTRIRKLAVAGGGGIDDGLMAHVLTATPALEELHFDDNYRNNLTVVGKDWPLQDLNHLRKVTLGTNTSEQLAGKLLEASASLESLHVSGDHVTGACWMTLDSIQLKELSVRRAPNLLRQHLDAFLQRAARLESLSLSGVPVATNPPLDLSTMSALRTLDIVGYENNGRLVVTSLISLKHLESISIRGVAVEHYAGVDFSQLTNLKKLHLAIHPGSFDVLGKLPPSLELLRLGGFQNNTVTERRLAAAFSQLSKLTTVEMNGCKVPPGLFEALPKCVETLKLYHCTTGNASIAAMLKRLDHLETLTLSWTHGGRGYNGAAESITGAGWDFKVQKRLRHLDLSKCYDITDELIATISQQLPQLETLILAEQRHLTGRGWNLERMRNLKTLDLHDLSGLDDATMARLPTSLATLRVRHCERITGHDWNLARLQDLSELFIESCDSLESLGQRLPDSLETIHMVGCKKLTCRQLDYSSFSRLRSLCFSECFDFDVDRLFAELPRYARSLQSLNLVGCRPPSTTNWNMAPLNDTLHVIWYEEADPAYVGGLDKDNGKLLQEQLPYCQIFL